MKKKIRITFVRIVHIITEMRIPKIHKVDCKSEKRTIEVMPDEGSTIKFEHWMEVVFKSFEVSADFECRLEKVNIEKGDKTTQTQIHRSSEFHNKLLPMSVIL